MRACRVSAGSVTRVGVMKFFHVPLLVVSVTSTTLHDAVEQNNATLLMQLLQNSSEAFMDSVDENQLTPLHLAAYQGHAEAADALLQAGAPVDTRSAHGEMTALHWAGGNGHVDLVEALLAKGADLSLAASNGHTVLHFAASRGYDSMLPVLLDASDASFIDTTSGLGVTALQMASEKGHAEVVRRLLRAGADMAKTADSNRISALHGASAMGHDAVVRLLLEAGASVEARDARQRTPLHLAAAMGQRNATSALVSAGAPLEALDADGLTPRWLAARKKRTAAVRVLREAGAQPRSPISRLWKRVKLCWAESALSAPTCAVRRAKTS